MTIFRSLLLFTMFGLLGLGLAWRLIVSTGGLHPTAWPSGELAATAGHKPAEVAASQPDRAGAGSMANPLREYEVMPVARPQAVAAPANLAPVIAPPPLSECVSSGAPSSGRRQSAPASGNGIDANVVLCSATSPVTPAAAYEIKPSEMQVFSPSGGMLSLPRAPRRSPWTADRTLGEVAPAGQ